MISNVARLQITCRLKSFARRPHLFDKNVERPSNVKSSVKFKRSRERKIECSASQRKPLTNSLEGLTEADGGRAVEDDIDVFRQDALILSAQIQFWLREVTVHCYDLVCKGRLFLLQSLK